VSDRVVGTKVNEREAPELMVQFYCPKCNGVSEMDAYRGVPSCPMCRVFLKAHHVVRGANEGHPLDDIRALRKTDPGRGGVM
jgi:hypothetical protein